METKATNTLKIAVTGGAGSGKTSVCSRLKELGLNIISSDTLAREAVAPGTEAYKNVVQYFGDKVLYADGNLNRSRLRQIIIKDAAARTALERVIHPEIKKLVQLKMVEAQQDGERFVLVEVPLLFELGLQDRFDMVVLVSAERELRIKRLMQRDQVSRYDAENLLDVQMPDAEKRKGADVVIKNDGTLNQLMKSIDLFYKNFYKKRAKRSESP
jgi:dephospho-CoA kinase